MSSNSSKTSSRLPAKVLVARVRRPHGVGGEVLVEVFSDVASRLQRGSEIEVERADGSRGCGRIAASRPFRDGWLVRLEGCDDRGAAEGLRGAAFQVPIERVPPAPSGAYYYFELAGCSCFDGLGRVLGRVADVVEDGGGILLRVVHGDRELLVPFVEAYLRAVDIAARRIELELPAGLIETCASKS